MNANSEYLKLIENYEDTEHWRSSWALWFDSYFDPTVKIIVQTIVPECKVSINTVVYSFTHNKSLNIHRTHENLSPEEVEIREKAFSTLVAYRYYYSTLSEIIQNNILTSYHFDQGYQGDGKMSIKLIDLERDLFKDIAREKEIIAPEGRAYNLKSGQMDNSFVLLDSNGNATPSEYANLRRSNPAEKKYQYEVIRWFLRRGILHLPKALYYKDGLATQDDLTILIKNNSLREAVRNVPQGKGLVDKNIFSYQTLNEIIEAIDDSQCAYHLNYRLGTFEAGFFELTEQDNTISHVYWVPLIIRWNGQETGGVFYINTDKSIEYKKLVTLAYALNGLLDNKVISELASLNRKSSETSAAVSISTRNINHNLGSHILGYLKNRLRDTMSIIENDVLSDLLNIDREYYLNKNNFKADNEGNWYIDKNSNLKLGFLTGLGDLLSYFQERQDYVGNIATGNTNYLGAVNLKGEVFDYFKAQKQVLSNIVLSEGYTYEDIEIYYSNVKSDTLVVLPVGRVGRQGVMTILENMIRNTAKHGQKKGAQRSKISISITISEPNSDFYAITFTDNSAIRSDEIIRTITGSLDKGLTKDGKINEENKGIKEMQIAAAWMRDIPLHKLGDTPENELPLLLPSLDEQGNLSYTFYLRKSKRFLIVTEKELDISFEGWKISSPQRAFAENIKENFDFILLDTTCTEDKIKADLYRKFVRCIDWDFNQNEFTDLDAHTAELIVYKYWLDLDKNRFMNQIAPNNASEAEIGIYDDADYVVNRSAKEKELISIVDSKQGGFSALNSKQILFVKHLDSENDYDVFLSRKPEMNFMLYAESITGNNSTARLYREDQIDELWCMRMRVSDLTRILVFDERYWRNFTQHSQKDMLNELMKLKNITVCSLEYMDDELYLVTTEHIKMGKVSFNGTIHLMHEPSDTLRFHFISLHQGLLDRMRNHAKGVNENAIHLTDNRNIMENFRKNLPAIMGYTVHSGRSVSTSVPPGIPFIPLPALDSALYDSKFSLTSLFYSATPSAI